MMLTPILILYCYKLCIFLLYLCIVFYKKKRLKLLSLLQTARYCSSSSPQEGAADE